MLKIVLSILLVFNYILYLVLVAAFLWQWLQRRARRLNELARRLPGGFTNRYFLNRYISTLDCYGFFYY